MAGLPPDRRRDREPRQVHQFLPIDNEKKGRAIPQLKGTPDIARGKELWERSGASTATKMTVAVSSDPKGPEFKAITGEGWGKGCLAEKDEALGKAPNFHLSAEQRGALLAFRLTDRTSLKQGAMPEFAERQITAMRCMACHNRDRAQSVWAPEQNDLDDEQEKVPRAADRLRRPGRAGARQSSSTSPH